MLLKYVILTCCKKLKDERTFSSIYHLLTGRRSIQTELDAYLFQLHPYYGIYKSFKRRDFDSYINILTEKGYLEREHEFICPTDGTVQWLNEQRQLKNELFYKGHLYHSFQLTFYLRFLLMIQVWTNDKMGNRTYLPVVDNHHVEQWVKHYYAKTKASTADYLYNIYRELTSILGNVSNRQANIFVDRMTGFNTFGLTINQLSEKYQLMPDEVFLHLMSVIHKIIYESKKNSAKYPHLKIIFSDLITKQSLSRSASQTNQLLHRGVPAKQIANKRQLSINTIYDHIVEIALQDDDFPYDQYVTVQQVKLVLTAVTHLKTYRLKEIKKHVPENINYFQIRLILTQLNKKG